MPTNLRLSRTLYYWTTVCGRLFFPYQLLILVSLICDFHFKLIELMKKDEMLSICINMQFLLSVILRWKGRRKISNFAIITLKNNQNYAKRGSIIFPQLKIASINSSKSIQLLLISYSNFMQIIHYSGYTDRVYVKWK